MRNSGNTLFCPLIPASGAVAPRTERLGLAVLGSTGSIGKTTLEIVRNNRDRFCVVALSAGCNVGGLLSQCEEFKPAVVGIADTTKVGELREGLRARDVLCTVVAGEDIHDIGCFEGVGLVVGGIVGIAGLPSTVKALERGIPVALANKESVVCGGVLLARLCAQSNGYIIPVDSEHSALFQALQGIGPNDVSSLVLTASGGPFRETPLEELSAVTPAQALKHPRWSMGPKVTIDSATMFNKALELIEARWLFGIPEERIRVLVHPQSIVHSLVECVDGASLAQLGIPDMSVPIAYALSYPGPRVWDASKAVNLVTDGPLEFFDVDSKRFPSIEVAREVLRGDPSMSVVFNAANEVCVERFLSGELRFTDIFRKVSELLELFSPRSLDTLEDIRVLDNEVRRKSSEVL